MQKIMMAAAALAATLAAAQASAAIQPTGWSFTPASQAFTVNGTISFAIKGQPTVNCNVSMSGQTRASGYLGFTSASFTDSGDGSCQNVSSPDVTYWYWNPTAAKYAHWVHAHFILSPKGIRCQGNLGMNVDQSPGSDTMVSIHRKIPSPAGACAVTATLDIGGVGIAKTPGQ